jgi:hypothetical protein
MKEKISLLLTVFLLVLAFLPGVFCDSSLKGQKIISFTIGAGITLDEEHNKINFIENPGFWHGALNGAMVVAQSARIAAVDFWNTFDFKETFTSRYGEDPFTASNIAFFAIWQFLYLMFAMLKFMFGIIYWAFQIFRLGNTPLYYVGIVTSISTILIIYKWAENIEESNYIFENVENPINTSHDKRDEENEDNTEVSLEDKYKALLNLKDNYSHEDLRAAYKKKMAQYHPDKVEHLGEKLKKVALEESVAIQEAYKYLSEKVQA